MLQNVLLVQQKHDNYIKQLLSKADLLTTCNKMLESQIAHQASSSSTPPSRLLSKPELNPKEHCNFIVLKSDKQLKGPMGARVEVESENGTTLPSEDAPQKANESVRYKESKPPSPKTFIPPFAIRTKIY